jgi:hypothetical protein
MRRDPWERRERFHTRFYLVAMLFIVFDIDRVPYPWAIVFKQLKLFGLIEMGIFVAILLVGFVYIWEGGGVGLTIDPDDLALTSEQTRIVEQVKALSSGFRARSFRGQLDLARPRGIIDALRYFKTEPEHLYEMLTDLTAVDYLPAEPNSLGSRCSTSSTRSRSTGRLYLKIRVADGATVPTATVGRPGRITGGGLRPHRASPPSQSGADPRPTDGSAIRSGRISRRCRTSSRTWK